MEHQEKNERIIKAFEEEGIFGTAIINELLRFRALDQIISANKSLQTYGLSLEELFDLGESSTTSIFGPITIKKEHFGRFYQLSFSVDPYDFIDETNYLEGIRGGSELKPLLDKSLGSLKNTLEMKDSATIVIGCVEEFAGLLGDIMQAFNGYNVLYYTRSDVAYEILKKVYPLANIVKDISDMSIDEVLYVHRGSFEDPMQGLIETTYIVNDGRLEQGRGHFFLHNRAFFEDPDQVEAWARLFESQSFEVEHWAALIYSHTRLQSIIEWLPYEIYEVEIGREEAKKVELAIKEIVGDNLYMNPLIPLHRNNILEMKHFSIATYGLALRGLLIDELGQTSSYGWALEGEERRPWRHLWSMDYIEGAMWALYLETEKAESIKEGIEAYAKSNDGFLQLLMAVRRPKLSLEEELHIAETYWKQYAIYADEITAAKAKWASLKESLQKNFS